MIAIIGSVGVALAGLYLLLSPDAAGMAVFGWVFSTFLTGGVLGVLGAVANTAMRARTRRARHPVGPERQ